jgi:hypothetical protein
MTISGYHEKMPCGKFIPTTSGNLLVSRERKVQCTRRGLCTRSPPADTDSLHLLLGAALLFLSEKCSKARTFKVHDQSSQLLISSFPRISSEVRWQSIEESPTMITPYVTDELYYDYE